jgi:hypothetical protein
MIGTIESEDTPRDAPERFLERDDVNGFAMTGAAMTLPVALDAVPAWDESGGRLREMDVLGIQNLFDHTGNGSETIVLCLGITAAGVTIERVLGCKDTHPRAIAATAAVAAVGVNVAYEAGVPLSSEYNKPEHTGFDAPDAVIGSLGGLMYAGAFCAGVLLNRRRKRRAALADTED